MKMGTLMLAAALALPIAAVSVPAGIVGLTAVSDSAFAQKRCAKAPARAKGAVGECLRRAGAPWGYNPRTNNCSFITNSKALWISCGGDPAKFR